MAKLVLTTSEFADLVIAFLFDAMVNPDELVIENEEFNVLVQKTGKMGAKPLFMKYYLNMNADDRLNYKRLKRTLEPGATVKSVIDINPSKADVKKGKGMMAVAKKVIKKLLLQQSITPDEVELIKEYMEVED